MEYAKRIVSANENWDKAYTNKVERELYRFMTLKNDDDDLSPPKDVDALWHQLLLDTAFYYTYCMNNYGKIIQHYPQNSDANARSARTKRLQKTRKLYKTVFGEDPPSDIWEETLIPPSPQSSRFAFISRYIPRRPKSIKRCGIRNYNNPPAAC